LLNEINYTINQMNAVEGDWKTTLYNIKATVENNSQMYKMKLQKGALSWLAEKQQESGFFF
jgi:hypothetical protein